ncbi:MAG TPA: hypothetical protein VMK42_04270 [Anaeromyxobacteraceae bacterium]|nr:hypothetical protein [Anaeromyxobacteraceae bacterium]
MESELTSAKLHRWITARWGQSAPATWDTRLTALRVLTGYCHRQSWLTRDPTKAFEHRRMPRADTAISFEELDALWSRGEVPLREKLLWRMLYATAARASEVLAVNVEDLDLAWLQAAVNEGGDLQDVAAKACHRFGWVRPNGGPPIAACSTMLRRLEKRGALQLPKPPRRFAGPAKHSDTDRWAFLGFP